MRIYGILANPAGHSLSPQMHNAAFAALGIEARYERFEIAVDGLADFMAEVRERSIAGLSVSLPFKESVIDFLDEVSEEAVKIGAVNTVVNDDGVLRGMNTDFIGFQKSLAGFEFERAVVFGAGGAARAVIYGLLDLGVKKVVVQNRDLEKARKLAEEFGVNVAPIDEVLSGDLFVQTSAIWHGDDHGAIEKYLQAENLREFKVVTDIAYKPLWTPLLLAAKEAGVKVITGEKMLLLQAVEQFALWTGEAAPIEVMASALDKELA